MKKFTINLLDPLSQAREKRYREWFFVCSLSVIVFAFFQSLSLIQKSFFPRVPEPPPGILGLTDTVKTIGSVLEVARTAAPYADFAGTLLAVNGGDARYLVLFQNTAELRPTGGFIGSYALVHVADGKVRDIEIPGGGLYDLEGTDVTQVRAPRPLTLFSPRWQIWNANWFPDFHASAQKIIWFYERSGGATVDGVVAIQPTLVERLLALTGPVSLPEYGLTVDSDSFFDTIQTHVEYGYDRKKNQPKAVIGALTRALLPKLVLLAQERTSEMISIFADELEKKRIQFAFVDPALESFVAERNWDGALKTPENDYFSLIFTNLGGGKSDRVTKTIGELTVVIHRDGIVEHAAKLYRAHQGEKKDPIYGLPNVDYLRFYAPSGSELLEARNFDTIPPGLFKQETTQLTDDPLLTSIEQEIAPLGAKNMRVAEETYSVRYPRDQPERRYTSFGNWMIVDPSEKRAVSLSYKSGFRVSMVNDPWYARLWKSLTFQARVAHPYALLFQKQSGVDADLWKIRIMVERGHRIASADPTPADQDTGSATWIVDTSRDREFRVMIE